MKKIHYGDIDNPIIYNGRNHIIHKGAMFGHWKVVATSKTRYFVKCICTSCTGYKKIHKVNITYLIQNRTKSCHRCTIVTSRIINRNYDDSTILYKTANKCIRIADIIGRYEVIGKSYKLPYISRNYRHDNTYIKVRCLECKHVTDMMITYLYQRKNNKCKHCIDKKLISKNRKKRSTFHLLTSDELKTIYNMYYNDKLSRKTIINKLNSTRARVRKALDNKFLLSIPPNCKRKKFDISKVIYLGGGFIFQKDDMFAHWKLVKFIPKDNSGYAKIQCQCSCCGHLVDRYTYRLLCARPEKCPQCKRDSIISEKTTTVDVKVNLIQKLSDHLIQSNLLTTTQQQNLKGIRL